jgi:S-(hydroxymethyl)glutathione dehydrogenase / alcohol dehydrogenase
VLFLSEILYTGYFGADIANVQPRDDVAVFGAEPVGYFATMISFLPGAARVFLVDHWPTRLRKIKDLGAEVINFDNVDPVERIKKETNGRGAICIDAVGDDAVGHVGGDGNNKGHDHSRVSNPAYESANPLQVINWICQTAKKILSVMQELNFSKNILLYQYQEYTDLLMINFH